MTKPIIEGDYVLASKYSDGSTKDQWCVGFFYGMTDHTSPRYEVVDCNGILFRGNGFRRCKRISAKRGQWLLKHSKVIDDSGRSIWWWARQKMIDYDE